MAKRELSSTLKNLKFMQRASQKDEKSMKEEEVVMPAGDFPVPSSAVKRCIVIVEGDPHPGATRGRMSFQNFNPSIDKLNEDPSSPSETESAATSSGRKNESVRENGSAHCRSDDVEVDTSSNDSNGNGKRKQHEVSAEPEHPSKLRKSNQDNKDSNSGRSRSSQKHNKREKLDWNVLQPPKYQSKR